MQTSIDISAGEKNVESSSRLGTVTDLQASLERSPDHPAIWNIAPENFLGVLSHNS